MISVFFMFVFTFIGFGAGLSFAGKMVDEKLKRIADTGIRWESDGRLYIVQSVELE